jgi:glycosyltransferase involved in cell wall biosynthesis
MKTSLKITIMIPTFNQAAYIREAIDSALAQTYENLEIVVGDDASTDETFELISKIADPRLKYIRNEENLGRVENYQNLLYTHATGDFVVNLDGDDYYTDPEFIQKSVEVIKSNKNIIAVVARATTLSPRTQSVSEIPKSKTLFGLEILKMLPANEFLFMHMAVVYSRSAAMSLGFYRSNTISSDWESLYRLILNGNVGFLDRNVGVWRIHDLNESGSISPEKLFNNLSIWPAIYSEVKACALGKYTKKIKATQCIAYFAQLCFSRISMGGNSPLYIFLFLIINKYMLAALLILLTPPYFVRLILSLTGYYRRKRVL